MTKTSAKSNTLGTWTAKGLRVAMIRAKHRLSVDRIIAEATGRSSVRVYIEGTIIGRMTVATLNSLVKSGHLRESSSASHFTTYRPTETAMSAFGK